MEIPAFAGMVCGGTGVCRWILVLLATYDCEIPAFAGMVCGGTVVYRRILVLLATHDCEIPAYAGMVCGGTGVCLRILVLLAIYDCEIPAYAGMVCGEMEVCIGFWQQCGRQFVGGRRQLADSPMDSRPPRDHSCVDRNLTVMCLHCRQN